MRAVLRVAVAVPLAVLLAACGDDEFLPDAHVRADAGLDAAPLPVELGTGALFFEPLVDGTTVPIIMGPQGGYHVWAAIRVGDGALDQVTVDLRGSFEDDGSPVGMSSRFAVVLLPSGAVREAAGLRQFIEDPAVAHGRRIAIHIDLEAADGRRGADDMVVVAE